MVRKTSKIQFGPENDIFFKQLEADEIITKSQCNGLFFIIRIHDVKGNTADIEKQLSVLNLNLLINVPL